MDYYKGTIPVIDDYTSDGEIMELFAPESRPVEFAKGLVDRDYSLYPLEMFDPPSEMEIIPESEWDARYDEQESTQSSVEHLYLPTPDRPAFVNLNQARDGYCWMYSGGHAVMLTRLRDHQPYVRLNPHSGAAIIKQGQNQGGWCGEAADFLRERGIAEEGTGPGQWPFNSRDLRHNTPTCRESMRKYRVTEDYVDLTRSVHSRNLTRLQHATALLLNCMCPSDYNWWGHSVCALRWVRVERGSWGPLILNSWPGWGRHGLAVLRGSRGTPDGAVCQRAVTAVGLP